MAWDASIEGIAFCAFVRYLDECEMYQELIKAEETLLQKAKDGDGVAAKTLCQKRRNYEYESWDLITLEKL